MKKLILIAICAAFAFPAFAKEVAPGKILSLKEADSKVLVGSIAKVIDLEKRSNGAMVRIVITDLGGSTDVSPRYQAYLTYMNANEMLNTVTAVDLGWAFSINEAKRLGPGFYSLEIVDIELQKKSYIINARQIFTDDDNLSSENGDVYFDSSLTVESDSTAVIQI